MPPTFKGRTREEKRKVRERTVRLYITGPGRGKSYRNDAL